MSPKLLLPFWTSLNFLAYDVFLPVTNPPRSISGENAHLWILRVWAGTEGVYIRMRSFLNTEELKYICTIVRFIHLKQCCVTDLTLKGICHWLRFSPVSPADRRIIACDFSSLPSKSACRRDFTSRSTGSRFRFAPRRAIWGKLVHKNFGQYVNWRIIYICYKK